MHPANPATARLESEDHDIHNPKDETEANADLSTRNYRNRLLQDEEATRDVFDYDNALSKMEDLNIGIRGLEGDGNEPDSPDAI